MPREFCEFWEELLVFGILKWVDKVGPVRNKFWASSIWWEKISYINETFLERIETRDERSLISEASLMKVRILVLILWAQ